MSLLGFFSMHAVLFALYYSSLLIFCDYSWHFLYKLICAKLSEKLTSEHTFKKSSYAWCNNHVTDIQQRNIRHKRVTQKSFGQYQNAVRRVPWSRKAISKGNVLYYVYLFFWNVRKILSFVYLVFAFIRRKNPNRWSPIRYILVLWRNRGRRIRWTFCSTTRERSSR